MRGRIFVFGSNLRGVHGAGSAFEAAKNHGAIWGQGVGPQGSSYAIPTKGFDLGVPLPPFVIQKHVSDFLEYAFTNPLLHFDVVAIGCGYAGYKPHQIAGMFIAGLPIENIHLPPEFLSVLQRWGVTNV